MVESRHQAISRARVAAATSSPGGFEPVRPARCAIALAISGGLRYVGKRWNNETNTSSEPAYTLADAGVRYTTGPWRFSLSVSNLFNKHYYSAELVDDKDKTSFTLHCETKEEVKDFTQYDKVTDVMDVSVAELLKHVALSKLPQ